MSNIAGDSLLGQQSLLRCQLFSFIVDVLPCGYPVCIFERLHYVVAGSVQRHKIQNSKTGADAKKVLSIGSIPDKVFATSSMS